MDPRHLLQLAEIVDRGSLLSAARALHVSQPTLTRNVQSLEARVGSAVLQRRPDGVTPTAVGRLLASEGRAIRESMRLADLNLDLWRTGLNGRLRIGVGTMLAHSLMPRFLSDPVVDSWQVAFWIDVGGANRLIERVRSNELDICIVQYHSDYAKSGLEQIALFEDERAYYCGEMHPLAHCGPVSDDDINRAAHVSVGVFSDQTRQTQLSKGSPAQRGPKIELSGDVAIALHLLSTGKFIAAFPEFLMNHLSDERQFVKLPYAGPMPKRTFSVWYMEDMRGHPLIAEFCNRFRRFISGLRVVDNA